MCSKPPAGRPRPKVTYTEEAVADIVEAITYLNERNPTAAAKLDADIARCIERLAEREFEGPVSRLRSGAVVRSWGVRPFRSTSSAVSSLQAWSPGAVRLDTVGNDP
jgi:plasmid stabilization system protein ParE